MIFVAEASSFILTKTMPTSVLWIYGKGDFPIQKKDGIRNVLVKPDVIADFRHIPFEDNSFYMVVFDPPHLYRMGQNSMLTKLYGRLNFDTWKEDLKAGFDEAWRILKPKGALIFKWCENDIKLSEVVKVFEKTPIFGNRSSKNNTTHWLVYMKMG